MAKLELESWTLNMMCDSKEVTLSLCTVVSSFVKWVIVLS